MNEQFKVYLRFLSVALLFLTGLAHSIHVLGAGSAREANEQPHLFELINAIEVEQSTKFVEPAVHPDVSKLKTTLPDSGGRRLTSPIVSDAGNWWRLMYRNSVDYVRKADVQVTTQANLSKTISDYRTKDTSEAMNKVRQFLPSVGVNSLQTANQLLENEFLIIGFGTFDFSAGIPWGESPVEGEEFSRSYYRTLHTHHILNYLVSAYEETGDDEYIEKGFAVIDDWLRKNSFENPAHELAWHDEGTARRLINWINFYNSARALLSDSQLALLLTSMQEQAALLASDSFHTTHTNHGMFQDEALLVFTGYFQDLPQATRYRKLAKDRLRDYFAYIISTEGVHLEHSPAYHQAIARSVRGYKDYFYLADDEAEFLYYDKLYDAMADYYTWVIKPDGMVPTVGDTFRRTKPPEDLWPDNPYYEYSLTAGAAGVAPHQHSAVFEEAGYAIFRDDWELGVDATYIMFTAAYHTTYHKHSDDLSVWIYANGHDLVTEAGPNGYDYKLPFTEFAYSSYAHNTLLVNDAGLPRVDGQYEKTYLSHYELDDIVTKATGVNDRYEHVTHEREVAYDRATKEITVTDNIESDRMHNYKLLWNLAEGVIPKQNGNTIDLAIGGEEVMSLTVNSTSDVLLNLVKGQTEPYFLGWQIQEENAPVASYTIVVEADAETTEIESIFTVN